MKIPLAYPVARRDAALVGFLDTFIGRDPAPGLGSLSTLRLGGGR